MFHMNQRVRIVGHPRDRIKPELFGRTGRVRALSEIGNFFIESEAGDFDWWYPASSLEALPPDPQPVPLFVRAEPKRESLTVRDMRRGDAFRPKEYPNQAFAYLSDGIAHNLKDYSITRTPFSLDAEVIRLKVTFEDAEPEEPNPVRVRYCDIGFGEGFLHDGKLYRRISDCGGNAINEETYVAEMFAATDMVQPVEITRPAEYRPVTEA